MDVFLKIHRLGRSYDTIKIDLSLHILIITGGVGLYALGFRIILGIHGIVDTFVGISFVQDMPRLRGLCHLRKGEKQRYRQQYGIK